MKQFLQYLFYPNPVSPSYMNPKVLVVLCISVALIAGSFVVARWRHNHTDAMLKKLSASWATAARWFGFTALIMIFARVEGISYVSIRVLWIVWIIAAILYVLLQVRSWQVRYYKVVPGVKKADPRSKYLPNKK